MTRRALLLSSVALALRRERLDRTVQLVNAKMAEGEVAAATLHIRGNAQVFNQARGVARTPRALLLLASITKPMTATAVMILADRGKLSHDDPVRKFIPLNDGSVAFPI